MLYVFLTILFVLPRLSVEHFVNFVFKRCYTNKVIIITCQYVIIVSIMAGWH